MHRPPRRRVSVGRSIGGADQIARTRLSRPALLRVIACVCTFAVAALPGVAHAQSTEDELAHTRSAIDATAERWFAAHSDAAGLDARIAQLERDIASAEARVNSARVVATARALVMYKGAGMDYANMLGDTIVESVRRAELIGSANERNHAAIKELTESVKHLKAQRQDLIDSRARLDDALQGVATERETLDAQLAALQDEADHEAQQTAQARRTVHKARTVGTPTAAPIGPPRAAPAVPRVVPPPAGAMNPHHNHPFLVCTRAHESNGNYSVVSSSGLYYGAYQFLPATWNATAAHAGRNDLIGVLPSRASAYDQDEMAWTLYLWQGNGPWGGRC
jgi:predicted  nucleic acid-binding Zn-ribbon protein